MRQSSEKKKRAALKLRALAAPPKVLNSIPNMDYELPVSPALWYPTHSSSCLLRCLHTYDIHTCGHASIHDTHTETCTHMGTRTHMDTCMFTDTFIPMDTCTEVDTYVLVGTHICNGHSHTLTHIHT